MSVSPVTDVTPLTGLQAIQQRIATLQGLGSSLGFASHLRAATQPLASTTPTTAVGCSESLAGQVVGNAISYLGVPYEWGGTDRGGIDCSGLVQQVYRSAGVELPRVAADQATQGTAVSAADAKAGDLVFFGGPIDHVGIYLGNGQMIDAPHTGTVVRIDSVDLSTASAIRRVLPSSSGSWSSNLPAAGRQYASQIEAAATKHGVDPALLASVAWQESGFQANAQSTAGAQGLMQLMPQTAAGLGVDANDPAQALDGGARYLKVQLDRFQGRADLALAAYNAGPTAVARAGGVPDYPQTQAYVSSVLQHLSTLRGGA